ncbi:hypothetical protein OC846_005381 [Tilletia horrida]|uniref:Thioredoxin domain-containing protein n=1 Tax=Tilletia horrida TaxID=155126 RepID=A0AAN6GLX9_9BASI|nr:hypothetical protein OC846_005381 [Tilletia horrida]KAK0566922.1 hypothetical protein OC861_002965 [Tilletia horrida]
MDRRTATTAPNNNNASPAIDLFAEAAAQDRVASSSAKSSNGLGLFGRRLSSAKSNDSAASSDRTTPIPTAAAAAAAAASASSPSAASYSDPANSSSVDSPGSRPSTMSMFASAAATMKASLSRPGSAAGFDNGAKSPVPRKLNISSPVQGSFTSSSPLRETIDLPNMLSPPPTAASPFTPNEIKSHHHFAAPYPAAGPTIITEEAQQNEEDSLLMVDGDTFVLSPKSPTAPAPFSATPVDTLPNHHAARDPLFQKPAELVPAASAVSPVSVSSFPGQLEVPAEQQPHVPLVGRGSLGKLSTPPVSSSAMFAASLRERSSMTNLSVAAVENGSDGSVRSRFSRLRTRSNEDLGPRSRRESDSTVKSASATEASSADTTAPPPPTSRHVPHQASIDTTAGMSVASTSALHSRGLVGSTGSNGTSMTTIPTSLSQPLSENDEIATLAATDDMDDQPSDLSDPRAPPPGSYAIHPPTMLQLFEAGQCIIYDENGAKLRFGDIFKRQRTLVCFLRHWWCGFCQEFALSLQEIDPEPLERAGLALVVIGQGDWHVTKAYKSVMQVPFPMYADPSRQLYKALGMTLRTNDAGPACAKPDYAKSGMTKAIVVAIKKGLFDMPLRAPGDMKLLGGEFILGPGLQCSFVHRMVTTRGHLDIPRVLAQAGIEVTPKKPSAHSDIPIPPIPGTDMAKDLPERPHSVNSMARNKRLKRGAKKLLRRGSNIEGSSGNDSRPQSRILGRNHSSATLDADAKNQSRSLGTAVGRQFDSGSKAVEQEGGRRTPTQETVLKNWGADGKTKYPSRPRLIEPGAPRPVSKDGPKGLKSGLNGSSPRIKEPVPRITSFAQRDIMQAALQPMSRDPTPSGSAGASLKTSVNTSPRPIEEDPTPFSPKVDTEPATMPSSPGPSSHRVSPVSASASTTFGPDRNGVSNSSSASLSRVADGGRVLSGTASIGNISTRSSRASLGGGGGGGQPSPAADYNPDGAFLRPTRANGLGRMRMDSSDTFDAVREKDGLRNGNGTNGHVAAAAAGGGSFGGSFLDDLNEIDGLVIRTPSPDQMRRMESPYLDGTDDFISEEDEEDEDEPRPPRRGGGGREQQQERQQRSQELSAESSGATAAAALGLNVQEVETYDDETDSDESDVLGSRASSRGNRITPDPSMAVSSPLTADSLRSGAGWYSGRQVSEHIIEEEEDEEEDDDDGGEFDQRRRSSEPAIRGGMGAVQTHSRGSSYEREPFSMDLRRSSTGMESVSSAGTAERIRRSQAGVGSVYMMGNARGQLQFGASPAFEDDEISESTEGGGGGFGSRRGSAATAELPFEVRSEDEERSSSSNGGGRGSPSRSSPQTSSGGGGASSSSSGGGGGGGGGSLSSSPTSSSPGSPSGSFGRRSRGSLPPQPPQPSQPLPPLRAPHRQGLGPLASAGQRAQLSAFNEEEEEEDSGRLSSASNGGASLGLTGADLEEEDDDDDDDDEDDEVRFVDSPEHPQPRVVEDEDDDTRTETQHGRLPATQQLVAGKEAVSLNRSNPHAELQRIQAERRQEHERMMQRRRRMERRGLDSSDEDEDEEEDDEEEEEEEEDDEGEVADRSNEAPWA